MKTIRCSFHFELSQKYIELSLQRLIILKVMKQCLFYSFFNSQTKLNKIQILLA